jgi:hypothetical protein
VIIIAPSTTTMPKTGRLKAPKRSSGAIRPDAAEPGAKCGGQKADSKTEQPAAVQMPISSREYGRASGRRHGRLWRIIRHIR